MEMGFEFAPLVLTHSPSPVSMAAGGKNG